jgi:hypothetical protein
MEPAPAMIAKQDNHRKNDGVDREGLTGMMRREAGTKLMIMTTSILSNPQMAMAKVTNVALTQKS